MDLERALALEIEERPDDDAGWLILADWLADRGEPGRADVVRLQVRLRQELDPGERAEAEGALRGLLASGVEPWMPRRAVALGGGVELRMVLIPPGHFLMGSPNRELGRETGEGPVHVVTLTRAFWLGVVPVTQAQWRAVMGTTPSHFEGDNRPVEQVSWYAAQEFCWAMSRQTGERFRLPTEAEWEYACRAGTTTPYHSGEGVEALRQVGWCNYEAHADTARETRPVGRLRPNGFGLYDMHGNVWEWCADWFESYTGAEVVDPQGPASGRGRVVRGGSWYFAPRIARSAYRFWHTPDSFSDSHGCRVVMEWEG